MRVLLTFAAAAALSFVSPAFAADATNQNGQTPSTSNQNDMICKNSAPATGSRLGARKVCMTRADWDRQAHNTQDRLNAADSQARTALIPGN